jgi:hypothetical protein
MGHGQTKYQSLNNPDLSEPLAPKPDDQRALWAVFCENHLKTFYIKGFKNIIPIQCPYDSTQKHQISNMRIV